MHAMHEMHGDHSLVEFEARSKSSNKIGNSYDMDRDSRDTDRSTYRSGYSRDTIECLCLFASVCLPQLCRVLWQRFEVESYVNQRSVLNKLYKHEQ